MKNEINNIEEIEVMNEVEVAETEPKQKRGSKIVGWGKKHGKKIVAGVAVAAVGLLGYALGQKTVGAGGDVYDEDIDFENIEDDFVAEVDSE